MYGVIEGLDKSGKSTVIQEIFMELANRGYNVRIFAEPYNCLIKDTIEQLKRNDLKYEDEILGRLFAADRLILKETIENLLKTDTIVLCDRSFYSSLAYQGLSTDTYRVNTQALRPDFVIYLDVDPLVCMDRKAASTGRFDTDKFETMEFLIKAQENYKEIIKREDDWHVIDGNRSKREVVEQALDIIEFQLEDSL